MNASIKAKTLEQTGEEGNTSRDPHNATIRIYVALAKVPVGRVVTYGDLAELAGLPRAARLAGQTLRKLPRGSKLPWHRVINAQGRISLPEPTARKQRARLELEGVLFKNGRIDLSIYRWHP